MKIFAIALLGLVMVVNAGSSYPSARDVLGLTEKELYEKYPETNKPSGSFLILVSKNLHPYRIPKDNVILRYGEAYLVFELANGKVIALHKVSG